MTVVPAEFEDLEGSLVAWLRGLGIARRVVTERPSNLQSADVLPLAEISDVGGPEVARGLDAATVDVDCYHIGSGTGMTAVSAREQARGFANEVRRAFQYQLPGTTLIGGAVVGRVHVARRPVWLPYDDTNIRRVGATYEIYFRQPRYPLS